MHEWIHNLLHTMLLLLMQGDAHCVSVIELQFIEAIFKQPTAPI